MVTVVTVRGRLLLAALVLPSCGGVAHTTPDGGAIGAGLTVVFRLEDSDSDVESLLLSVAQVEVQGDVGGDERLRDDTWHLVDPFSADEDRIALPSAPPGTFSRVRVLLESPPDGSALPDGYEPPEATWVLRGTRDGSPAIGAWTSDVVWDLRCDEGVKLAPGSDLELVVQIDSGDWLDEEPPGEEDVLSAARLECDSDESESKGSGDGEA